MGSDLLTSLLGVTIDEIGKWIIIVGLLVYILFAFIVVRQVKLMTQVVSGILTNTLRLLSWLFLFSAIGVAVIVWIWL